MSKGKLKEKIKQLKIEKNAVILAHNYQIPEVQDIADHLGDSLGLSRIASSTEAEVVVFCGVQFMAETASILCPDKKVLLPDEHAGCPMADMITAGQLRELKKEHPKAIVVAYVNTPAEVKAESDICCTSANAIGVVEALKNEEEIIFVPDKYLGGYASMKAGKKLILWNGYCPSHVKILPEDILKCKEIHPEAKVIVHPECTAEVIALADEALSTGGMCRYAKESDVDEMIVGTEPGMIVRLEKENPGKRFYPASDNALCPNMKKINLEKIIWSLEEMRYKIKVPEDIRLKAKKAVDRMLALK